MALKSLFLLTHLVLFANATPPDDLPENRQECGDLLVIDIDLRQGIGFEPYDVVQGKVDWRALSGRSLAVKFKMADERVESVRQTPMTRKDFSRTYPRFLPVARKVVSLHEQALAQVEASWRWRLTTSAVRVIGQGRGARDLRRKMPGELAMISILIGEEDVTSPLLTGLIDGHGKAGAKHDELTTIMMSSEKLRAELPQAIARHIHRTHVRDHIEADVLFFHTHAGVAAPLSPADDRVIASAQRVFTREFPYVSFRFFMVAASKLDAQGDLLFVKKLVSPASAKLSQLLK